MTRKLTLLTLAVMALAAMTPAALAQAPPFTIRVQLPQTSFTVQDGGAFTMQADAIGVPLAATVTVTYTGATATGMINAIELSGANDFFLSNVPDFTVGAVSVFRGQSLTFGLRYLPTTSNKVTTRLGIAWAEGRTTGTMTANVTGIAPEFTFSYIPQGGNQTLVAAGGTITAPLTNIDATSNTVVVITNKGGGPGVVDSISLTGSAFALVGVPLPQATVEAGKELRFTVAFTPKQLEPSTGALQVALYGKSVSFALQGEGSGPEWAYETIQESTISAILPGQLITLPEAIIGEKSTIMVRVRNVGNADGRIAAINVSGQGFTLTDAPFTPLTMVVDGSATVTITFTPTQAGRVSGRLRIGVDSFEIAANGLGSVLQYAYAIGSTSITIQNNGQVAFTPAAVGRSSDVRFTVNNTGTAAASVGSISIVQSGTVFALAQLPPLPLTIQPGSSFSFQVTFTPIAMGSTTATLKLDSTGFTLSGIGNTPAALPEYRFDGASGTQEPLSQPAIGLSLAQAYPLALNGTLTLNFFSDVGSPDPSVQFVVGGRTINFTIPANSTRAVFANNATQLRIQTGSVAGTITLTPSFITSESKIDLTPINPTPYTLTIPQQAPRLLGVSVSSKTSSGFTLLVTGMATGRSVTQMDFTFTPTTEEKVATTSLTVPVEASFVAWYASTASQAYGSLFTASVPFSLQGDVNKVTSLADTIQSVSVTLSNRVGKSQTQSVNLR